MKKKKTKKQEQNIFQKSSKYILLILLFTSILGIGYAQISAGELSVSGTAIAHQNPIVIITGASYSSSTNADTNNSAINGYTNSTLNSTVTLTSATDSSITYSITVENVMSIDARFVETAYTSAFYDNDDITFELTGLDVGDILQGGESRTFTITFSWDDPNANHTEFELNSYLNFKFEAIEKRIAFLMEYDGANNFLGLTKSTITKVLRDTTSTKAQIEAMANKTLVSNTVNDGYKSDYPIYAYSSGTDLYLWSEADEIAFHPETLHGFKEMAALTNVDFTGMTTEYVQNFAHWFDTDKKLVRIDGEINTDGMVLQYNNNNNYTYLESNTTGSEGLTSGYGMAFMFNDCNALTYVDTSNFNTTNASDMKRMFAGCKALLDVDLSSFDTSNVKSMYWMFRKAYKLKDVDLSSFDTSKVVNMLGMFVTDSNSAKTEQIILGSKFDTRNVVRMTNMFYNQSKLKQIDAKMDFRTDSLTNSTDMFRGCSSLAGAPGETYEFPFDSSKTNATYAVICRQGTNGYLTENASGTEYRIVYDLDGGMVDPNPTHYYSNNLPITLYNPTKLGYTFTGWTGSNGNTPERDLVIPAGTEGVLRYYANYTKNSILNFPKVFDVQGSCTFDGLAGTISGSSCEDLITHTSHVGEHYIDTGICLYCQANASSDYEIYFDVGNDFTTTGQEDGQYSTAMNSKLEDQSRGYPGTLFRRNGNRFEIKSASNSSPTMQFSAVQSVRIVRADGYIYYSFNGDPLTLMHDNRGFTDYFDLNVWFGAARNSSNTPFRSYKGTLSNMYIRMGNYAE